MWPSVDVRRDSSRVDRWVRQFSNHRRRTLSGHTDLIDGIAFNSVGTKLASVSRDKTVRVWSIDAKKDVSTQNIDCMVLKDHVSDVDKCAWNPINPDQLATCSADKSIKVFDTRTGKLQSSLSTIAWNIHIRWSPCGKYIIFCNNKNVMTLARVEPTLTACAPIGFEQDINAIEFDKNSERVLLGCANGTVQIVNIVPNAVDPVNGNPSMVKGESFPAHRSTIYNVVFDSKYKYLATGAADAVVNVFNTSDMVCVRSFTRLDDCIRCVAFSGDASLIALGGKGTKLEVADVESGARVWLQDLPGENTAIAFHPSAPILAYATTPKKHTPELILISAVPPPSSSSSSSTPSLSKPPTKPTPSSSSSSSSSSTTASSSSSSTKSSSSSTKPSSSNVK